MSSSGEKKNHTYYLSLLSVISSIAVVYLHANGCFWKFSTERYWLSANVIESIFYFAVPIFFMIPGATLLNFYERYSLKEYFKKRIAKTLIPYLVFSIIGLLLKLFVVKVVPLSNLSVKYVITGLLNGSHVSVYWFFPVLFCVYLCIPLLAAVEKEKRKAVFSYLAVACFVLNITIPYILNTFHLDFQIPYTISVGSGYLFYVIIGYLLHEYDLKGPLRICVYALALAALIAHIVGTYFGSYAAGEVVKTFKGYTNLPCVLYSIGIFLLVKNLVNKKKEKDSLSFPEKAVRFLSSYTFSIYMIHYFLLQFMILIMHLNYKSILFRLLGPIPVIAISILITFVLRKIPVLRRIVPE